MSTIVDIDVLSRLVGGALAAAILVTTAFAFGIYGAASFGEARRAGRAVAAGAYGAFTVIAFGAFAAGVVFGITVLTSK